MLDWLAQKWVEMQQFFYSLLLTIGTLLKDLFIFIYESFLNISVLTVSALDGLFDGLDIAQHFSSLPPEVTYYASALGLSQAMSMIIISITIRFLLQLIPFIRLGS